MQFAKFEEKTISVEDAEYLPDIFMLSAEGRLKCIGCGDPVAFCAGRDGKRGYFRHWRSGNSDSLCRFRGSSGDAAHGDNAMEVKYQRSVFSLLDLGNVPDGDQSRPVDRCSDKVLDGDSIDSNSLEVDSVQPVTSAITSDFMAEIAEIAIRIRAIDNSAVREFAKDFFDQLLK